MREYNRARYKKKRQEQILRLGGKCVWCGTVEDLQFDHIEASSKVDTIGRLWDRHSSTIDKELSKCQLLCRKCHTVKSIRNKETSGGHNKLKSYPHGHWKMYNVDKCRCLLCREWKSSTRK